jgi:hypothetical protein
MARKHLAICRSHTRGWPYQAKLCTRAWSEEILLFSVMNIYADIWVCVGHKSITVPTVVCPFNSAPSPRTTIWREGFYQLRARCFPVESDFSLIDQFVARNNPALENILSNLKRCDAALLESFYQSAFEGLDPDTCEAILHLWMRALSPKALVGIQNTYSRELTYPGLCFQKPITLTRTDHWRYTRGSLSYIARMPWRGNPF